MSAKSEQVDGDEFEAEDEVCASCGIAAVDDITLKKCACNLVKYCTIDCQKIHRPQHKRACRKRLAELHDKQLFTQPDISHWGECPICCLPLSIDPSKSRMMPCCCKIICLGCDYANYMRENEQGLEHRCVYCREPVTNSDEEVDKRIMERVNKHNPDAITHLGKTHDAEGDYGKALEYYTNAAELGDVAAHACLGNLYFEEKGVERDMKKAVYHWEQAAIGGHPNARVLLANYEEENDRFDRAAKHVIIGANLGHDVSLQWIKDLFVEGLVSKEDYAAALRGYQAAVDATKSPEREEAEARHVGANRRGAP